jgi:hypothetical protein
MWRSNEHGESPLDGIYERERLRRMARKLGLRLLKFDGNKSNPGRPATADRSRPGGTDKSGESAFVIDKQAS